MGSDIKQVVAKCFVCMKYKKSQRKEPMIPHDIIDGRWKKIAMDIMTFHRQDYIILNIPSLLICPTKPLRLL